MTSDLRSTLSRALEELVEGKDTTAQALLMRRLHIDDVRVRTLVSRANMRWVGRRPSPALNAQGNFVGTNLDLATILVGLLQRRAVVHIPRYTRRRPKTIRADVRRIGTTAFGHIEQLVAHPDAFSFSILLHDHSVIVPTGEIHGSETIGAPRSYMVLDLDGSWHRGWKNFGFAPTASESEFFAARRVMTRSGMHCNYFVHPNRYQSFFGIPYVHLKMLLLRLEDEVFHLRQELKRLDPSRSSDVVKKPRVRAGKTISIKAFEVELDMPAFVGSPSDYFVGREGEVRVAWIERRLRTILGTWMPLVRFIVRADELAYYKYAFHTDKKPGWAYKVPTEQKVRVSGSRALWKRIRFSDEYALRFREYVRKEVVAK